MTLLLVLLILTFGAPGEPAAPPVAPVGGPEAQPAQRSDVALPIEISIDAVDRMFAGGDHGGLLYEKSGIEVPHGALELKIRRAGALTVAVASDGSLDVRLPVKVHARVDLKLGWIKHHEDLEGALTVHGKLRVDVAPDRPPRLRTALDFTWVQAPSKRILGKIDVSLGTLAGGVVREQLDRLAARIDDTARERVERAWQQLTSPLTPAPGCWLVVAPEAARMARLQRRGDALVLGVGLHGRLAAGTGAAPPAPAAGSPPPLELVASEPGRLDVHVRHVLGLNDLAAVVTRLAADGGLDFKRGGGELAPRFAALVFSADGVRLAFTAMVELGAKSPWPTLTITGSLRASDAPSGGLGLDVEGLSVKLADGVPFPWPIPSSLALDSFSGELRRLLVARSKALASTHGVNLDLVLTALRIRDLRVSAANVSFDLQLVGEASVRL